MATSRRCQCFWHLFVQSRSSRLSRSGLRRIILSKVAETCCAEPTGAHSSAMEIRLGGRSRFRSNPPANRWRAGRRRTGIVGFRGVTLPRSQYSSGAQHRDDVPELRTGQRVFVALSMADYLPGCWEWSDHAKDPGYKPSSLRTGNGRQSDPSKVSIILMRPAQHGHGGGWCLGLPRSLSSPLRRSVDAAGTASKLRQSASLSARWPLAKRP